SPESCILFKILGNPPYEVPVGISLGSILLVGEAEPRPQDSQLDWASAATSMKIASTSQISMNEEDSKTIRTSPEPDEVPRGPNWVKTSPAARKAARELGVKLEDVTGSGPGGRITREDVEAHHNNVSHRIASVGHMKQALRAEETGVTSTFAANEFRVRKL